MVIEAMYMFMHVYMRVLVHSEDLVARLMYSGGKMVSGRSRALLHDG